MSFRVVLIENDVELSLKLNNLVVNRNCEEVFIPLNDISVIVVDNLKTNVTTRLLSILSEENIGLVICDKNHLPIGSLISYSNHSRSSKMLQYQVKCNDSMKNLIWDEIVKSKIINQAETLEILIGKNSLDKDLRDYIKDVKDGDKFNREGTAAKAYFTRLMGTSFSRSNKNILLNSGLDYGYSILRTHLARLLIGYGFNCQLGLHHKSEYNTFNLVDDIIEPIRPIFDLYVFNLLKNNQYFLPEHRQHILNFVNHYVVYNNKKMYISNMMEEYVVQITNCIKNNVVNIIFPHSLDYLGDKDEI